MPGPSFCSRPFGRQKRDPGFNVKQLMTGSDPGLNVPLEGGEEIRVPEARKIYVVGNVKKPGADSHCYSRRHGIFRSQAPVGDRRSDSLRSVDRMDLSLRSQWRPA